MNYFGISEARLDFSDLIHLEFLDIKENLLQYIPGNLENLKSLKYLDLSYNKLRRLPEYFKSNLETLILDGNKLKDQTKLPTWIIKLKALKTLSLAAVWFKELIDVFIEDISLNSLVKLDLRCSNIDLIPQSLMYLEKLEVLELGNCREIMDSAVTHWNRTECSFKVSFTSTFQFEFTNLILIIFYYPSQRMKSMLVLNWISVLVFLIWLKRTV